MTPANRPNAQAGAPPRRVLRGGVAVLMGVVALTCLLRPTASWAARSSSDQRATRTYLRARYTLGRAELRNVSGSRAAITALASKLERECPAVLASAPSITLPMHGMELSMPEGEYIEQRNELQIELSLAFTTAWLHADDNAARTFVSTVASLHWSNPRLTHVLHLMLAQLEEFTRPVADVCADMRAWVASDYRTLTPETKQLLLRHTKVVSSEPNTSLDTLLEPQENPADRALARRITSLVPPLVAAASQLESIEKRVGEALGLKEEPFASVEAGSENRNEQVIGHGTTAAGGTFTIGVAPGMKGCSPNITVTEVRGPTTSSLSGGTCGGPGPAAPSVACRQGLLRIEAGTLPEARSVRLLLSSGQEVISPAFSLPAGLGGPDGFYYQAVTGPSPIPVSLTELDANGNTLRVQSLRPVVECTKEPRKVLAGGVRTLARGKLPSGSSFSIVGERFSFLGHVQFELGLTLAGVHVGGLSEISHGAVSWALLTRCSASPYIVVLGVLRAPADTLFARTSRGFVALHKVPLPASLHVSGDAVYGVFSAAPTELLLRSAHNHSLHIGKIGGTGTAGGGCSGEGGEESGIVLGSIS